MFKMKLSDQVRAGIELRFRTDPTGARAQAEQNLVSMRNHRQHTLAYVHAQHKAGAPVRSGPNDKRTHGPALDQVVHHSIVSEDEEWLINILSENPA